MKVTQETSKTTKRPRLRYILFPGNGNKNKVKVKSSDSRSMEAVHDLEHSLRHFILYGKCIGLYPSQWWIFRLLPLLLAAVTLVDWVGMFLEPTSSNIYRTAAEICGKIGSPQFYTIGTFCYFYIQNYHEKLVKFYEKWKTLPLIKEDKYLTTFVNLVGGAIMISAILENAVFHFKLFPVFEEPIQNLTSFEVYYMRSHGYWALTIPFTPYQATLLLATNKMALYAWNFSDILTTVLCRALRFRFDAMIENIEVLGPAYAVKRHEELIDLMKLLENYLSPLVFCCFYLDFYATCMQLHMWMTPGEHKHFLHTIYLLWAFIHLIVRVFLLSYQASRLHESSIASQRQLHMLPISKACCNVKKQISRIEYSAKRQLAISGLGCFLITKRFLLTLIYVAFSFQIFLMQSESLKCP